MIEIKSYSKALNIYPKREKRSKPIIEATLMLVSVIMGYFLAQYYRVDLVETILFSMFMLPSIYAIMSDSGLRWLFFMGVEVFFIISIFAFISVLVISPISYTLAEYLMLPVAFVFLYLYAIYILLRTKDFIMFIASFFQGPKADI